MTRLAAEGPLPIGKICSSLHSRCAGDAFTRAKESARQYAGRAREGYDEAQEIVRRRPAESVAVAFGTGLLVGVIVGLIARSR